MHPPKYWSKACKELSKKDPKMAELIKLYNDKHLTSHGDAFKTLANAIVGQQISVKAADAIWARFLDLFPRKKITAKKYLELKEPKLKEIGLSKQKILYLKNIADYFIENKITKKYFEKKSSEEIAHELLAIKGIGKWTLEMFQIFYLNEPDVFPIGDIGLIKAVENIYDSSSLRGAKRSSRRSAPQDRLQSNPYISPKEKRLLIEQFSERWKPYRTVATWYLWRSIDADPVHY